MNDNKNMEKIRYQSKEAIKSKLRRGDYELIGMLTKKKYKQGTVKLQLNGYRTLKKDVIEAANKLIINREELLANNS